MIPISFRQPNKVCRNRNKPAQPCCSGLFPDLRLLGLSLRNQPVSTVAGRLLPWAWVGFLVQIVTGVLLFSSEATKCYTNMAFRLKMLMILLAGVNAMVFHWTAYRSVGKWDDAPTTPIGAKFAGSFSILLWFGIVAAGRWIAFI